MSVGVWVVFLMFIIGLLALDLGVFQRSHEPMSTSKALIWTGIWVFMALIFNIIVYFLYDGQSQAALEFAAGYLIEKSLSLDNIFVIALIFSFFHVPADLQRHALAWGIIGAIVLRFVMVLAGAAALARFDWVTYVFGSILLITAVKMLLASDQEIHPDRNIFVRLIQHFFPVTQNYHQHHFFVYQNGRYWATRLLLVVVVIESSDVLFAIDSISAIFSVTKDPFIVFTSNIFAIFGLRALYFALAVMIEKFKYLKVSLVFLLSFVGIKMLLTHHIHIPTVASLIFIIGILGVGVLASILSENKQ